MRWCLVFGAFLDIFSGFFRYISVFVSNGYGLLVFGQCLGALAQPCFLNAPVALAGNWFSLSERDSVMVIAAMSNPVGNAIGQVLPPFWSMKMVECLHFF
eukprot:TRINITY_DN5680_c0_g1_i1.p1 TRINITY_DN5680_c0_g1~~TRINITY_DN5680_c0_g1_i1.p1  ORF type:complete len:100 (+),score=17.16 TRINITY_DN5680_c0_g1_i1:236-535(+)